MFANFPPYTKNTTASISATKKAIAYKKANRFLFIKDLVSEKL